MSIFVRDGDLNKYFKDAPVTSIIILLNLLMLLVTFVTGGFGGENLLNLGALYAPYVKDGEYYRLLASMFLHGSFTHFLANIIIGLYVLSSALERMIGSKKFALIYFISGLGAGLLITFTSNALTIGASGAIFGALGALLFAGIYRNDLMSRQDFKSIKALVTINIIFTFISSNISISGHLGGIATGFIISYLIIKQPKHIDVDPNVIQSYSYYSTPDEDDDDDIWDKY